MKNWSKRFQSFWLHSSVFALDKQPKKLDLQSFFTSQRPFGGYFQRKACTTFQNICSLTKYSNAKLIKNILNFPVAFHGICFRKTILKSIFHSFLISNRIIGGLLSRKHVHSHMSLNQAWPFQICQKSFTFLCRTPPFLLLKNNMKS